MYTCSNKFCPRHQCGFRKSYNVQYRRLVMIEKKREARGQNKVCAAVLTYLSRKHLIVQNIILYYQIDFGFSFKSLESH